MSRDPNPYSSSYQELQSSRSRPAEGSNTATSPTSPYSEGAPTQMATLHQSSHIQQQVPYRGHSGYSMYSPHSQSFPPPQQPAASASQQPTAFPAQPAPRQRTAIACRYCRRRKIRCHGFDSSPDGRCTNCLRFHQECIFTPVSTQGHAFVPAHTAYPHLRNARGIQAGPDGRPLPYPSQSGQGGPPLYGAHGQPLGPVGQHEPNYNPHQQPAYMSGPYSSQPPPTLPLPPPSGASSLPIPGHFEDRPPPPLQEHRVNPIQRRGSSGYEYPDPTVMAPPSPASSATSYQSGVYASATSQPYYQNTTGDRRVSPTSSYFPPRAAGSPHGGNGATVLPPLPAELHPPLALPSGLDNARNSSPNTNTPRTGGLSVGDLLATPTSSTRSSTDNDMLNALNRKRR